MRTHVGRVRAASRLTEEANADPAIRGPRLKRANATVAASLIGCDITVTGQLARDNASR